MGKVKIDIGKAIEMRVSGATLRDIGNSFNTSGEAIRQAFQRAKKKQREQKKMARLLVTACTSEQGSIKSPSAISKTIDEWATIIEAAKKGIALESEVASLRDRLAHVEQFLSAQNKKTLKVPKTRRKSGYSRENS